MSAIRAYLIAAAVAFLVAVAAGGAAWASWSYRGHLAEKEVDQVRLEMNQLLIKQTQLTDHYQALAQEQYGALMEKLGSLKITYTTVNTTIAAETTANPGFYNQPLPTGGRDAWLRARTPAQ